MEVECLVRLLVEWDWDVQEGLEVLEYRLNRHWSDIDCAEEQVCSSVFKICSILPNLHSHNSGSLWQDWPTFGEAPCHGMTFSDLSFHQFTPLFYRSWTNFLSFAYFHTLDIRKAKPEGIHWTRTTWKDHLLLMWSWHLPPVDDVAAVPQLLHVIGLVPVYHDLQAC